MILQLAKGIAVVVDLPEILPFTDGQLLLMHLNILRTRGNTPQDMLKDIAFHLDGNALPEYDCPNCNDDHKATRWCDGCDSELCQPCYDEHNHDAPDHTEYPRGEQEYERWQMGRSR